LRGDEMLVNWQSTRTELAGMLTILSGMHNCEIVPTFLARALSGAPMREETFETLLNELLASLSKAGPLDGVLLVLHGAMMSQQTPDATGKVLEQVRALVGADVPIVGTLDLHANVTARMVREATALIGYHTVPHIDMFEAGQKAASVMIDTVSGKISPVTALVRLPMLVPPENSTHNWAPLGDVISKAIELEKNGMIIHGGIYPVQVWMDTPDIAASVVVIVDKQHKKANKYANMLAEMLWTRRHDFAFDMLSPEQAVNRAITRTDGMVILCDSADATSSGSTGDSTAILKALLHHAPFDEIALVNIVDPGVVIQALDAGIGATLTVDVGGKLAPGLFAPVEFTGYVKTISDGTFVFKGPGMRGVPHHMGRTVVLYAGGIHLVVMERGVSQWDPQMYRSLGEEPADARMVQVKSPMVFRAAYEGLYDEVIFVDAPGAASPQLTSLQWQYLPRPMFPFDPNMTWTPG
ncbi:MAG: M81 family metallopeptidase, partial [Anaerolineae bacterium]|nr:M81 family metallopeptidase [Anaerolineae bacterium]